MKVHISKKFNYLNNECYLFNKKDIPEGLYYIKYEPNNGDPVVIYPVPSEHLQDYLYNNIITNEEFVSKFLDKSMFKNNFILPGRYDSATEGENIRNTSASRSDRIFLYNFIQKILKTTFKTNVF